MLNPGQSFAHFQILDKLGEGGMGAVYLVEDRKLGRQVALKILPREYFDDPERLQRFEREARTAASINHPNVTAIYDIGEATDEAGQTLRYIVMEYVPGTPLNRYLQDRTLERGDVLRLGEKIAAGLAAAHKLKIIHRDIKPENVIVSEDGVPKILDFGLAKPIEPVMTSEGDNSDNDVTRTISGDLTQVGRIVGTVNYMSPEQAQGQTLDTRSDIFSFGVLLYRLATGEAPFAGPTQVSTLAKIIEGSHAPARTRDDGVHPELERIIDKCLHKDPKDRYQDTRDLVVDLRNLRRQMDSGISESISNLSAADIKPVQPTHGGARRWIPLAAVGALALGAVLWFSLRGSGGGAGEAIAGERSLAILSFQNRTGDAEMGWMETGLPEILLTDLTQCEGLSLISRERVRDGVRQAGGAEDDHDQLVKASRKLGASDILTGSFYKLGPDRLRIDARLEDLATGKIVLAEKVEGSDPFVLVDSLTARVAAALHAVEPADGSLDVAEITTASTDAYREYTLGHRSLGLNLFDEARAHFTAALEADSSFAQPYMGLALSHVLEGRLDEGATWLVKARARADRLPAKDRNLVNIFTDLWINQQYSDAMAKLQAFTETYPEEKLPKSLNGILVYQLVGDTTRAYGIFDEVLAQDPGYPVALELYADCLQRNREFARAAVLMERFKRYYPESPTGWERLGDYRLQQGDLEEARTAYTAFRERFPAEPSAITSLYALALRDRDFEAAAGYLEDLRELKSGDPQWMRTYHLGRTNVALWRGNVKDALSHADLAVNEALALGDSLTIFATAITAEDYHDRLGSRAKAREYLELAHRYAPPTGKTNYYVALAESDPERALRLKGDFEKAREVLRARVPQSMWFIADVVDSMFNAYATQDTSKLIGAFQTMLSSPLPSMNSGGNRVEMSRLLLARGEYAEILETLDTLLNSPGGTGGGFTYPYVQYLAGRAQEGLGRGDEAIGHYREMLKYWGNAAGEIEEVRDAKARLANLTS